MQNLVCVKWIFSEFVTAMLHHFHDLFGENVGALCSVPPKNLEDVLDTLMEIIAKEVGGKMNPSRSGHKCSNSQTRTRHLRELCKLK